MLVWPVLNFEAAAAPGREAGSAAAGAAGAWAWAANGRAIRLAAMAKAAARMVFSLECVDGTLPSPPNAGQE